MHWIQTYILEQLSHKEFIRNRDLRPNKVESNLFQYHLSQLVRQGYVRKDSTGYTLAHKGMGWSDRYSNELRGSRTQTKIITIIGMQNNRGDFLLIPKMRQPFVNSLYFPSGKTRLGESHAEAAVREVYEKLNLPNIRVTAQGSIRICISDEEQILTDFFGLLYTAYVPHGFVLPDGSQWHNQNSLDRSKVMPGTEEIMLSFAEKTAKSEIFITI